VTRLARSEPRTDSALLVRMVASRVYQGASTPARTDAGLRSPLLRQASRDGEACFVPGSDWVGESPPIGTGNLLPTLKKRAAAPPGDGSVLLGSQGRSVP